MDANCVLLYSTILLTALHISTETLESNDIFHKIKNSEYNTKFQIHFQSESPFWCAFLWSVKKVKTLSVFIIESRGVFDASNLISNYLNAQQVIPLNIIKISGNMTEEETIKIDSFLSSQNEGSNLIVTTEVESIVRCFEMFMASYFFKPRAKFVLIHVCIDNILCEKNKLSYTDIFVKLWDVSKVLQVVLFTVNLHANASDTIFTYTPFINSNSSSRGLGHELKLSGDSDLSSHIDVKTRNLHGYPLRVTLFPLKLMMVPKIVHGKVKEYIGRDGRMLSALVNKMNFTPIIISPNDGATYGYLIEDGTFRGTLGHLVYNKADLSINSRYIRDYGSKDVEYTAPAISQEQLCVLTPKATKIPTWVAMMRCYSPEMWGLIVLSYIASAFIWAIVRKIDGLPPDIPVYEQFMVMLNIFLSNTLMSFTKYFTTPQRIFLTACMLFSIVIINIFIGNIYNALTVQSYFSDIKNLEDLDRSGFRIAVFYRSMIDTFDDVHNPIMRNLKKKFFFTKSPKLLENVAEVRNLTMVNTKTYLRYVVKNTKDGEDKLSIVEECPRTYDVSYIVPKKSPYKDEFYKIISHLTETGHVIKWTEDYIQESTIAKRFAEKSEGGEEEDTKVFTLSDLQVAFYVLVLGLPVSTALFIAEMMQHRIKKRRNMPSKRIGPLFSKPITK